MSSVLARKDDILVTKETIFARVNGVLATEDDVLASNETVPTRISLSLSKISRDLAIVSLNPQERLFSVQIQHGSNPEPSKQDPTVPKHRRKSHDGNKTQAPT